MATQADLGKKALAVSNFDEAIAQYTLALKAFPTAPDYLIGRATAYQRAKRYIEALHDANHAVTSAHKRAKRELIIDSQFRRGCALYSLGRFADAQLVLDVVKRMKPDHAQANMWMSNIQRALESLPEGDIRRKCTVAEVPDLAESEGSDVDPSTLNGSESPLPPPTANVAPVRQTAPQTPVDKVRYDWYQNTKSVYFTLLAKSVPKDKIQVDITPRSLSISYPLITGSSYDLTLDPLFAEVSPTACTTRVMPTKVEIILVKATPGTWSALESSEPVPSTETQSASNGASTRAVYTQPINKAPVYPTSSRNGPKDWDKITSNLSTADPAAAPGSAEADEDFEGGDEANHFFKKLFKGATPEAQKAMMKSYTESNGTALSTNWEEVSKGKVETVPPEGMESRTWES